jgi:hypothetical protein
MRHRPADQAPVEVSRLAVCGLSLSRVSGASADRKERLTGGQPGNVHVAQQENKGANLPIYSESSSEQIGKFAE